MWTKAKNIRTKSWFPLHLEKFEKCFSIYGPLKTILPMSSYDTDNGRINGNYIKF